MLYTHYYIILKSAANCKSTDQVLSESQNQLVNTKSTSSMKPVRQTNCTLLEQINVLLIAIHIAVRISDDTMSIYILGNNTPVWLFDTCLHSSHFKPEV